MKLFSSRDLSIHPSVSSSIHGWHHTKKKTLAEINNLPSPPLRMCHCLGKACLAPGRGRGGGTPKILIPILATNPTYTSTKNYIYEFQIAFISKT
jgi:hypothetical protein